MLCNMPLCSSSSSLEGCRDMADGGKRMSNGFPDLPPNANVVARVEDGPKRNGFPDPLPYANVVARVEGGHKNHGAPALLPSSLPSITVQELAKHNTADDLWIAIHGCVYDVTVWLSSHPGGEIPLLSLAGKDATDPFLAFHPPSSRASAILPRLLVATLSDYQPSPLSLDYQRTMAEIRAAGLFRKQPIYYAAAVAAVVATFLLALSLALLTNSTWMRMLGAALLGLTWMQSGWIGHDSGHGPLFGNRVINRIIQVVLGNAIAGISISWWKRNHNAHHIACNSAEYDPDLQYIPIFAVSSRFFSSLYSHFYARKMQFDTLARNLISYQHLTFYPVMALARINLFALTFTLLISGKNVPGRRAELAAIACFWAWFSTLLWHLPSNPERIAFVLISFAVTGIQHVQFCLNHFSSPLNEGQPDGATFFRAQVNGTMNITCPPWMDWFHGGLQFQLEHHLFPRLPRRNLRQVANIIKPLCAKHGLPYVSVSFWEANLMILRTLRAAALQARDLSLPPPKNLLWEAVNAVG